MDTHTHTETKTQAQAQAQAQAQTHTQTHTHTCITHTHIHKHPFATSSHLPVSGSCVRVFSNASTSARSMSKSSSSSIFKRIHAWNSLDRFLLSQSHKTSAMSLFFERFCLIDFWTGKQHSYCTTAASTGGTHDDVFTTAWSDSLDGARNCLWSKSTSCVRCTCWKGLFLTIFSKVLEYVYINDDGYIQCSSTVPPGSENSL